ncbi:molybdopterin-guanine dinucleotide biosynthesis protein B [Paenibacillus sp. FSL H8-0537]|uniref:molybdopterin-guanine dinucleotide biosynthesis protein B n=1 Tax=Paenibacillus sp. FSL H8-0537 TaxID=2921399 RepID=UPI003101442A
MHTSIIQIVGFKNTGKTTLTAALVKQLAEAGCRVGTVKHDGHDFDIDHPGTDTWQHREAGAHKIAITSPHRTAIMEQRPTPLKELLQQFGDMDWVIVEGFKQECYPKIVLIREEEDEALVKQLEQVVAVASWYPVSFGGLPVFAVQDSAGMAAWIQEERGKGAFVLEEPT